MITAKLKAKIREIIRRNYEAGTPERIKGEIKKYFKENFSNSVNQELINKLQKDFEKEFGESFIKKTTGSSEYLKDAKNMIRSASLQTETIKNNIAKNIFKAIDEGIKGNLAWQDIARESLSKINVLGLRIQTEIDTHKAAADRLIRVKNLEDGGWKYLRYAGPSGTIRPFCIDHVGRIYSIEEIKKMVNMFGQPALYYQGGYNCRHRWDPVDGSVIEDTEDGRIFAQKNFTESRDGKEITIAKFRIKQLKQNSTIQLNSKVDEKNFRSADVFENGVKTEYKRVTDKSVNLITAIRNHLRYGKEQAGRIVVWIDRDYDTEIIKKAIKSAEHFDLTKKIKEVIFLDKSGKEIKL
ncbi:MAG: hypothetical protein NZM09_10155 [Ignavibacterium sp.]|nr:hypothetical protein [Ignavibacterium sp.]MDW8376041.1 hypothetical protein [Ignavibacteriales bacterium]